MRNLTEKEIATLTVYGCTAENWKSVWVHDEFDPKFCSQVHFSGENILGKFEKIFELPGGVRKHAGLYNSIIHNCEIGNDVYINHVHNYMANYKIEDNTFIEHIDSLICTQDSRFGNGTQVNVMIESGQRAIPIYASMSNVIAYLMTFYRHLPEFTQKLFEQTENHIRTSLEKNIFPSIAPSQGKKHFRAVIGKGTLITNSGEITNINAGPYTQIRSASKLSNGTLAGNETAPVIIGTGVIAEDFIVQSGAIIDNGSMISRCLIGQGTQIDKQFSAIDSLFFANSQGFHGEAISVFAGPFTVSHHRSTLLLASLYSFYNAGSGSNFSNHMYKLGPVHQGITERGVKTSSNSYILWPARIGAFNVVLGTHKGNPDLSNIPFSYLMEVDGESILIPGLNMQSAGTDRDVRKWAERDNRKDTLRLDIYHTDLLNPYLVQKMMKGQEILQTLYEKMEPGSLFVWYQNCKIKKSSLKKGIEIYQNGIDIYLKQQILKLESQTDFTSSDSVVDPMVNQKAELDPLTTDSAKKTKWVDLAGMIISDSIVEELIQNFTSKNQSMDELQQNIVRANENREASEHTWIRSVFREEMKNPEVLIEKGNKAEITLKEMIGRDARKEFNSSAKTGFGIDGEEEIRNLDFLNTRGSF